MSSTDPLNPFDMLRTARDTASKMQELIVKSTLPPEHRKALVQGLTRLTLPGEQLEALIDLADAFGPPTAQIAEVQKTLDAQREQLNTMLEDLTRVQESVDRLAAAAEQLAELQKPLRDVVRRTSGSTEEQDGDENED